MFYQCPVCGYSQMQFAASEYNICPCCGTEFGYDDFSKSHRELRNEWLRNGARWFSTTTFPPFQWNGFRQVYEAGFPFDVPPPHSINQLFPVIIPLLGKPELQLKVS